MPVNRFQVVGIACDYVSPITCFEILHVIVNVLINDHAIQGPTFTRCAVSSVKRVADTGGYEVANGE